MGESINFIVGENEAWQRLDVFLAARLTRLSRMRIASLVLGGACTVNGALAHAGRRLDAGDSIDFDDVEDAPNAMTPEALPLEVVHEDEQVIVVVKPAGLLVHPTRGVKSGTLANALTYHLNREQIEHSATLVNPQSEIHVPQFIRPGIIHRLDRDTSGLLVVAKTQSALSRLTQHFQRRLIEKRYLAVVSARVEQDELTIDAPIGRDEEARPRWRVLADGKDAETRLRVLRRAGHSTLVELEPVTGRTNQLRIHCAHVGYPIVGDRLYGGDEHTRLCLHASRLGFRHPATNDWIELSSEMPSEMRGGF